MIAFKRAANACDEILGMHVRRISWDFCVGLFFEYSFTYSESMKEGNRPNSFKYAYDGAYTHTHGRSIPTRMAVR